MNAVTDRWLNDEPANLPAGRQLAPAEARELASRAVLKADMLALECRIATSMPPCTADLVELAAVGAAVAECGPRGGRWLQRSKAERLVQAIEGKIQNNPTPRIEDFVKLVLAAAVLNRDTVHASPEAMAAAYQAANAKADEHVSPSTADLVQLTLVGAAWAQSGPRLSLQQLRVKRQWVRDKVFAYQSPQAREFIELAVLEVVVQVAERNALRLSAPSCNASAAVL
ncbi:MAG: hypothetical protein H7Y33_12315 [Cytophagales bacterium]|nr:hypothetical protein [Rhizobacter sp.]